MKVETGWLMGSEFDVEGFTRFDRTAEGGQQSGHGLEVVEVDDFNRRVHVAVG